MTTENKSFSFIESGLVLNTNSVEDLLKVLDNISSNNKFENLLLTKDCLNLSNKKIIKKNYKLIKSLENNCFFEKN